MNLDDSRIAAMRHQIMTEVTSDQRRRTHRLRSGVAAFMGVLVIGGIGIATIPNLGTDDDFVAGPDTSEAEEPAPAQPPLSDLENGDEAGSGDRPPLLEREPADPQALPDPAVVNETTVHIVVDDPRAAVRDITDWAEEFDGTVDERRESQGEEDDSQALVSVRIPFGSTAEALDGLERFGEITSTDVTNRNVSMTIEDLDADIRALQASIDRLQGVVDNAESSDLLDAERELTQRESDLDAKLAEREQLVDQVSMAAVTITFDAGSDDSGGSWGGVLTVLPWIGLVLLAALVGWLFMRRGRDRPARTERAVNQWA